MAVAKPAASSHTVLCFPSLISPPCLALRRSFSSSRAVRPRDQSRANHLRIRYDILLQFHIIQQIEIGIQVVIVFQCLKIALRSAQRGFSNRSFLTMFLTKIDNPAALREVEAYANSQEHRKSRRQHGP